MKRNESTGNTTYYIGCDCHEVDHVIALDMWDDEPQVHMQVCLIQSTRTWERIKRAVRHVLGRDGCLSETILSKHQALLMADVLLEKFGHVRAMDPIATTAWTTSGDTAQ